MLTLRVPIASLTLLLTAVSLRAEEQRSLTFNRDIRPILSDRCYLCHGPDEGTREADLRLDLRGESALAVLSPGKAEASEVVKRIFSTDADEVMPPPESHKALTPAERDTIRRWVDEGAKYESHWAYQPLERPAVPTVGEAHPIDAFVVEKLRAKGADLSPEASPERLLRRLSLDLTGLPPTEAERAAFLADRAPGAYERQVDRLLASPRFGERMAVWWLDVARFADTVGFHGDQNQRIFPYRDYVIDAFNANKPFDRFTTEQLAGDLLPDATPEQRVATGYNRLNMMTREGGAQSKEYLAKYGAERVRSVSTAWLGSTFGCAECHDHKFDPIPARDFYELQAFFADVKQWGVYHDYGYTPNPELKGFSNDHPFPPELLVESPYLQARDREARTALLAYLDGLSPTTRDPVFVAWQAETQAWLARHGEGWAFPELSATRWIKPRALDEPPLERDATGGLRLGRATKSGEHVRLVLKPEAGRIASLRVRLEGVPFPVRADAGGFRIMEIEYASGETTTRASVHFAEANHRRPRYRNGYELDGVTYGWRLPESDPGETLESVWVLSEPLEVRAGDELRLRIGYDIEGVARIGVSPLAALDPRDLANGRVLAALATADGASTATTTAAAANARRAADAEGASARLRLETWLVSRTDDRARRDHLRAEVARIRSLNGGKAWTLVTESAPPLDVRVLPRGNWQDESGPLVLPATPSFLPGRRESTPERRLTRLDLAEWLLSRDNPLTARTVANRLWLPFYGTALSAVVDDLGSQGELPSHPELLDWLAVEFREGGWDVKRFVRLLVTSRTYRQSTQYRPEWREADPANRLLAAQNPRRLDAEFVRDNALFVAGLLDVSLIGGPSARPYQPAGHYAALQFPDREYLNSEPDEQWRRGVYMHWQRTFLHPMLVNFDAPNRDECTAQRSASNTPQQALTLLNDPTFVEAARVFALRLLESPAANDAERVDRAFVLAVGRTPAAADRERLLTFLKAQQEHYAANPDEAKRVLAVGLHRAPAADSIPASTQAAWTQLGRVLLNAQETITRY
jgi:hypothetical protein